MFFSCVYLIRFRKLDWVWQKIMWTSHLSPHCRYSTLVRKKHHVPNALPYQYDWRDSANLLPNMGVLTWLWHICLLFSFLLIPIFQDFVGQILSKRILDWVWQKIMWTSHLSPHCRYSTLVIATSSSPYIILICKEFLVFLGIYGHLGWKSGLLDAILKRPHPRTAPA
jgi:hypothetical protein